MTADGIGMQAMWAPDGTVALVRDAGGVVLCVGCQRAGACRLGILTEQLDDDVLCAALACPPDQEGGPGVAHGAWTAGVFDDVLGHLAVLAGGLYVTGTLTVRYERPVPVAHPVKLVARIEQRNARTQVLSGELLSDGGVVLAEASAVFVRRVPAEHFTNLAP